MMGYGFWPGTLMRKPSAIVFFSGSECALLVDAAVEELWGHRRFRAHVRAEGVFGSSMAVGNAGDGDPASPMGTMLVSMVCQSQDLGSPRVPYLP